MVSWLRWAILATLLLIAIAWPTPGRTGQQLWVFVLIFCGYNTIVELLQRRMVALHSFAWVPFFDLPVAAILYSLDAQPGGPLFVAFFLAVVTAAVYHGVRWTAIYTVVAAVLIAAIAPTLPQWMATPSELRQLAARLVILCAAGIGAAILMRHLDLAQRQAQSMRWEAEVRDALDRLRTDFIATVSHDLRTPLTAVRAGLGLIETRVAGRLRTEEVELLANARRNAERLGLLIDDLLAFNQIETGTLGLDPVPLDLREVVTDAVAAIYSLLEEKRQSLELDLPEPLPVSGDQRRLEQMLVNLLANAHYHTPPGTRIVAIGRVLAHEAVLTIRDDGPGIPRTELTEIFRRYHRSSSVGSGSGLGLAIAAGIVRLHDGRIWAESEPNQGAAFHVALPHDPNGEIA
jgi:signal transduction histidine kinase